MFLYHIQTSPGHSRAQALQARHGFPDVPWRGDLSLGDGEEVPIETGVRV